MHKVGIIAGSGQFPLLFAQKAREKGYEVIVVAHENETSPEIEKYADKTIWVKVGKLGKIIDAFKNEGVTQAAMAGGITKTLLYQVRPDIRGIFFLARLKNKKDDTLLRGFAEELEREGIEVVASTVFLKDLCAPKGNLTNTKPTRNQMKDVEFGWDMAKKLGSLDIGQTIIVRNRVVLAVEATEGTDAAILRGGEQGKGNVIVVKICKPNQDLRFDLPSIGVGTIESLIKAKAKVLAIESEKTLIFEKEKVIEMADREKIAVISM